LLYKLYKTKLLYTKLLYRDVPSLKCESTPYKKIKRGLKNYYTFTKF